MLLRHSQHSLVQSVLQTLFTAENIITVVSQPVSTRSTSVSSFKISQQLLLLSNESSDEFVCLNVVDSSIGLDLLHTISCSMTTNISCDSHLPVLKIDLCKIWQFADNPVDSCQALLAVAFYT